MRVDRRVAAAWIAAAAAILIAAVASDGAPEGGVRSAARDLLVLARAGDYRSYRADYTVAREVAGRTVLSARVTVWARARPWLVAEESGSDLTVVTRERRWTCTSVQGRPACLEAPADGGSASGAVPFLAALVSGRYRVERSPARRLAGEVATCFVVRLRPGRLAVLTFGRRLDVCFAPDGVLLASTVQRDTGRDVRTASRIRRGVSAAELRALARRATDGSVATLARR